MPAEPARAPGEKRRIDPGVARIVGRKNVGESYEHIARSIKHRANRYSSPEQKAEPEFPRKRSEAITEGLIAHRRNRQLYEHVMGQPPEFALTGHALLRHFARQEGLAQQKTPEEINAMSNDQWMRHMTATHGLGSEGNY